MNRRIRTSEAPPHRIVAYLRVSTEKQADKGVSLDAQRAKVEGYARLYELELVDVIVDAGASAKTLERPGLQRALAMLRAGEASGLLVAKLDRLTRSVRDLGALLEELFARPGGPALMSVGEQLDTRSAAGRMVMNLLAVISQWEREAIGERTRDALAELRAQGRKLGAPTMLELGAAEGVRAAAELAAAGMGPAAIAEALNARGVPTAKGARWWPRTVRRALELAASATLVG